MSEKITILVGDDSILARKQLKDILVGIQDNLEFVDASNGQEAVDKFKEVHPDIVFLDIVMPVKDGIAATAEIIADEPKAKIIIVSSVGTQTQLKAAIESGAKDFIQKPIRAEQVIAIFNTYIGG
ncbi:MAG: response regulator [Lachnospiraceae bacterium]|jgi:two-component system chemotaxis response regulator CheY|nr:response regulator [Lachnospiraceae bacterium]MBQ1721751.1 response regulator [Lachnospiraceae bacterium]MBQ2316715.1 response regulator [Lachnospiraceae bacterium]MBQ2502703.1 response regulator [Lachnospiraceae bacterium]MBQ2579180.1 response regulator [Lachnospiraceae bacterium]